MKLFVIMAVAVDWTINEKLSPQEKLVQDIVSILHEFSCRLYGLCKYQKQIEGDETIAQGVQDGNSPDESAKR